MKPVAKVVRRLAFGLVCGCAGLPVITWAAPPAAALVVVAKQGTVEVMPAGITPATWLPVETNSALHPLWRLRTLANSRVTLQWPDLSVVTYGARSEVEILPPPAGGGSRLRLIKGLLSFLHKDEPGRIQVITRGAHAGIKGTEFVVAVEEINGVERTTISVIDGLVSMTNEQGFVELTSGQQAIAEPGLRPTRTPGFIAKNVLQWCFYYPAVLDLRDLPPGVTDDPALAASLAAYRQSDLLAALAGYPAERQPASDAERVYHAALLLSVGEVAETEKMLDALPAADPSTLLPRLSVALRQLIAAVKRAPSPATHAPQLSTELLAASYYEQSRAVREDSLRASLALARQAATNSPTFSFAWARVAELEFSFGRSAAATKALEQCLAIAPHHPQALALQGFLLAARNRTREAGERFDRAIAVDPALGNAWLGRGLVRIRRGDALAGRADLLVAASLEPQRSALRSYLGKALAYSGDTRRALHELDLARTLDPADPTPWLYAALVNEQANRINEGIRDLERSVALNDNRRLYRSELLLDQDRAVREANLARLYADAGLADVAVREAGKAVADDYTSFSAHLFLANAYQELRPATPFGQRYETPNVNEYLLTALLGPADGRLLAQPVSQLEYTRLFERDGLGFSSSTEYLSRGAWQEYAAQYGSFANTSYALEVNYLTDPGQAENTDFESRTLSAKVKQMLTPQDSMFFQVFDARSSGGDTAQRYDPSATALGLEFDDKQSPGLLLGYHREWSPDSHTLALASHVEDNLDAHLPGGAAVLLTTDSGDPAYVVPTDLTRDYSRRYVLNSVELQQIEKFNPHTFIAGLRLQSISEKIDYRDAALPGNLSNGAYSGNFPTVPYYFPEQQVRVDSSRVTLYAQDYWQLGEHWLLFGGATADFLTLARNDTAPPLNDDQETINRVSPLAGMLWQPGAGAVLRAAWSRSLTGQSLDQSLRLEPAQFAGLPLTFRSAMPDSLVGGLSGESIEILQGDGRFKFGRDTYALIGVRQIESKAHPHLGAYKGDLGDDPVPATAGEKLSFRETSLEFSLRRLLGDWTSLGVRYEVAKASLDQHFADIDPAYYASPRSIFSAHREGVLQSVAFDAVARHPAGYFASAAVTWRLQTALEDTQLGGDLPDESFWQLDLYAGYRSPRRTFEGAVGLLNATGNDYRLHPINLWLDVPRQRTLALVLRLNF